MISSTINYGLNLPYRYARAPLPPRRPIAFPPEILLHILSFISNSPPLSRNEPAYVRAIRRNATLAPLALVSRAFLKATYSILYGDLHLAWMSDIVWELLASFKTNPALSPLVRRLVASTVDQEYWIGSTMDYTEVPETCEVRMTYDSWESSGHDKWWHSDQIGYLGTQELGDVVGQVRGVRTIVAEGFALPFHSYKFVDRGPYRNIQSLEMRIDPESISSVIFAATLAALVPNLRFLSVSSEQTEHPTVIGTLPPIILPPSLTHLVITKIARADIIPPHLRHIRPVIHSLTLTLNSPWSGWSRKSLWSRISSDKVLILRNSTYDFDSLASTISSSSSLRHLEIVGTTDGLPTLPPSKSQNVYRDTSAIESAVTTLIPSLPSSIESLLLPALTEMIGEREHVLDASMVLERALRILRGAPFRPLRVEFVRPPRMWTAAEAAAALDEWRDAYAAEDITVALLESDE